MAFTFVDVLSLIPGLRLSTCLECKKPHTEETIRRTRHTVDALPVPSSFETLPQLLVVATELLCPRDKSRGDWYARIWFGALLTKAVPSPPDMPGAYPQPTVTLEPYLRRKRHMLSGKEDAFCHGCGECFKAGTVVYSTICGRHLCDPNCATARGPSSCYDPSFCQDCDTAYWTWTVGEADPYARYNLWRPHLGLRIEYSDTVVLDTQYSSTLTFWPLLGELCDQFGLDLASAAFYR
jgi:hypothetical protein